LTFDFTLGLNQDFLGVGQTHIADKSRCASFKSDRIF
jgi:hypothetical protein